MEHITKPNHYNSYKQETYDKIIELGQYYPAVVMFSVGNMQKYLDRSPFKGTQLDDLRKMVQNAEWAIKALKTLPKRQLRKINKSKVVPKYKYTVLEKYTELMEHYPQEVSFYIFNLQMYINNMPMYHDIIMSFSDFIDLGNNLIDKMEKLQQNA